MASDIGLTAKPLSSGQDFNWVFLIELLISGILIVFFLFYFNRLLSTLVSFAIRAYTWRVYRAYIDIQALQISLLGGRLFFKGIRYHAHNETIVVHGGFITWKYWLRKVRDAEVYCEQGDALPLDPDSASTSSGGSVSAGQEEKGGQQPSKGLPCRIQVKVSGLEAFIYNRSPVYDAIIESITRRNTAARYNDKVSGLAEKEKVSSPGSSSKTSQASHNIDLQISGDSASDEPHAVYHEPVIPAFLKLFPIHVSCNKAAAVLGNENTRCILTANIDGARGVFDAGRAGPLDIYKQIFSFDVDHPVITMKPNVDFRELQLATAARLKDEACNGPVEYDKVRRRRFRFHVADRAMHALEKLSPRFRKSLDSIATATTDVRQRLSSIVPTIPGHERWMGLTRYLDAEQSNEHDEWEAVEYAKYSTIADIPKISFTFYWDIPGQVRGLSNGLNEPVENGIDEINGTTPPRYGMDLHIHGGIVNYGPWADRMRVDFQNIFFPSVFFDAEPTKQLSAGQYRLNTVFKLFLCIEEDVTLRLPFKENSKDWRWKGQAESLMKTTQDKQSKGKGPMKFLHRDKTTAAPTVRPFAWMDIRIAKDTTINYIGDQYPSSKGYKNSVVGDVTGTEIYSSVNHGMLWRSGKFALDLDISYPLGWKSQRDWRFDITSHDLHMFILRDHLFLLTDLVLDWTSGPIQDYYTFVPYIYQLNLAFHNFKLYLNTNDANVINEPANLEDNHFLILYGERLFADVRIPLDQLRPRKNEVPFKVKGLNFGMDMQMPPRSTLKSFVQHQKIATLDEVTLNGSHSGWTETSFSLTDTLTFDIHGTKFLIIFYGFLAHHFVRVKENYFGDDLHFRTLEEFQQLIAEGGINPDADTDKVSNRGNDLDVILSIVVDDASVIVPANLYNAGENITIEVPFSNVDLRIGNYYMDLMLDISPVSISLGRTTFENEMPNNCTDRIQIFIDTVQFMGSRFFGLPPTEPAYCCNWDVEVGNISGECCEQLITVASQAAQAAIIGFPDAENTISVPYSATAHDVQFLQLRTKSIHIWLRIIGDAILVDLRNTTVEFNDLATKMFSGKVNIAVPQLTLACVDCANLPRHNLPSSQRRPIKTHAYINTSVTLKVMMRQPQFEHKRSLQQAHIRLHDRRTYRTQFLLRPDEDTGDSTSPAQGIKMESPAMTMPTLPEPLTLQGSVSSGTVSSSSSSEYRRGRSAPASLASARATTRKEMRSKTSHSSLRGSIARSCSRQSLPHRSQVRAGSYNSKIASTTVIGSDVHANEASRASHMPEGFSVAFSSSLVAPSLALDSFDLDLAELPPIRKHATKLPVFDENRASILEEATIKDVDPAFGHTSLVVAVNSDLQGFFSAGAVTCGLNILKQIEPRTPEAMVDSFHGSILGRISNHIGKAAFQGSSLDLALKVPSVSLRFFNQIEKLKDQLDVTLSPSTVSLRTIDFPVSYEERSSLSLHILLEHIGVALREVHPDDRKGVAIQAHVDEVLVWLVQKDSLAVNVSYRALQLGASSREIDYLAHLVDRYVSLGQDLATQMQSQIQEQSSRLQFLTHSLTIAGKHVPDPAFLTRASYVMRSANGHVRQHDSWKIISRLRFIYFSLSQESKTALADKLANAISGATSADAHQEVLDIWDRWRVWDLAHVKNSTAMRIVYGDDGVSLSRILSNTFESDIPLDLSIRAGKTGLIIDPGPKQSKFSFHDLAFMVAIQPSSEWNDSDLLTHYTHRSTRIQIDLDTAQLHVDWHIWNLVERLTNVVVRNEKYRKLIFSDVARDAQASHPAPKYGAPQDLQVVLCFGAAELIIKSNNLRSTNVAKGLKLSVASSEEATSQRDRFLNILLHSSLATADLHSGERHLVRLQSRSSSLFFSQNFFARGSGKSLETIKVLGSTKEVVIRSCEEVLGLIEIVDLVIGDEILHVKQQLDLFKSLGVGSEQLVADRPSVPYALPELTVVLTMDSYEISIALLQSLAYSIEGTTGRFSIQPDLGQKLALKVDVDLDEHTHFLRSLEAAQHTIAAIGMPRVNAQVLALRTGRATQVTATVIMETFGVDASALHGLVDTIRRPELTQTFNSVRADIFTLQQNIERIFPSEASPTSPLLEPSSPEVEYKVRCVLAGVRIQAATQGSLGSRSDAKLTFGLRATRVTITNSPDRGDRLYPIPEFHAQINQIYAHMTVLDGNEKKHCGDVAISARIDGTVRFDKTGVAKNDFAVSSKELSINLYADTASAVVDVVNHLQDRIKDLDLSRERRYLRRLKSARRQTLAAPQSHNQQADASSETASVSSALFRSSLSLKLREISVKWVVGRSVEAVRNYQGEDLVFSIKTIDLATTSENQLRLAIIDLQLALMTSAPQARSERPWNSAVLPELVFNAAYHSGHDQRGLRFQAAGKLFDVQLEPKFMIPLNMVQRSITLAVEKFRSASSTWQSTPTSTGTPRKSPFGNKRLSDLVVDADFAGAQLSLYDRKRPDAHRNSILLPGAHHSKGKYGQFMENEASGATTGASIRSPGLAVKVEYTDSLETAPTLNVEVQLDASSNTLYPNIAPLIIEISDTVKEIVRQTDVPSSKAPQSVRPTQNFLEDSEIFKADPTTVLGKIQLNFGFKICKQEFSLSCQPVARVAASAKFEKIYLTINSVRSNEQNNFFALSTAIEGLQASVQHVYSRESTFSFDADSIVLSLINSKHLNGTAGISAILKVSPMRTQVNVRQLQDFLLFREIWFPREIRDVVVDTSNAPQESMSPAEPHEYLIQRYRQVSATGAFPWTATVAIEEMSVELDLGQAIGRSSLKIKDVWATSKKSSDWEQTLCIGIGSTGAESTGRMSGLVELQQLRVRTTITWPQNQTDRKQTPLIQASAGFDRLRLKAAFDYQAFAIGDVTNFDFMMYNVRANRGVGSDRLIAILNGGNILAYVTSTTASQVIALIQAFQRLVQDNETAYAQSLRDVEKFLRRKSSVVEPVAVTSAAAPDSVVKKSDKLKTPVTLHTDVVVTLKFLSVGCFPSSFTDTQVLTAETLDVQARFAVALEGQQIHSALGMTLGQLRVALAAIPHSSMTGAPKVLAEIEIDDVVNTVVKNARGGTILRVPKVIGAMQTWQVPTSKRIQYIFKSSFEGKVDVGWNLSRINSIRNMWGVHARTLAARLGKPVPEAAVKVAAKTPSTKVPGDVVKAKPEEEMESSEAGLSARSRDKISAVVDMPASKYEYIALEEPVIATPQLRNLGEATPPLEWIGLHRDRLPNLTHAVLITSLLEIASEVEAAYSSILGRS